MSIDSTEAVAGSPPAVSQEIDLPSIAGREVGGPLAGNGACGETRYARNVSAITVYARENSVYTVSHGIAATYGDAVRESFEEAADSAMRMVSGQDVLAFPVIWMGESLGLAMNACTRISNVSQEAMDALIEQTRPLRRPW